MTPFNHIPDTDEICYGMQDDITHCLSCIKSIDFFLK